MCGKHALCACEIRFGDISEDVISVLWTKPVLRLGVSIEHRQFESIFTSLMLIWKTLSKKYRDASRIICIWTRVCSDGCAVESDCGELITGILYVPFCMLLLVDTHQGMRGLLSSHPVRNLLVPQIHPLSERVGHCMESAVVQLFLIPSSLSIYPGE